MLMKPKSKEQGHRASSVVGSEIAGGLRNVSCRNNSKTESISMHMFPWEDVIHDI